MTVSKRKRANRPERVLLAAGLAVLWSVFSCAAAAPGPRLVWEQVPDLPNPVGVAGPFVGISNDALIVGGGANFPDAPPWEGGTKAWSDEVWVLLKQEKGSYSWLDHPLHLPKALAYGVSITTDKGIILLGGSDAERCYDDVIRMSWDPAGERLITEELPSLPRPLAFMSGALVGTTIYLAGGQEEMSVTRSTSNFWALDLSKEGTPGFQWQELDSWPGPPRVLPVAAGQSDGEHLSFYLFSGRNVQPGQATTVFSDAYQYSPETGQWETMSPIGTPTEEPLSVQAVTALPVGEYHILVFGGGLEWFFLKAEAMGRELAGLESRLAAAGDPKLRQSLEEELTEFRKKVVDFQTSHPGFQRTVRVYHTLTDTWARLGEMPTETPPVTTTAVRWGDSFFLPTGEVHPGVRSPQILRAELAPEKKSFGWLNWFTLSIYLLALVGMGFYFSRRENSTDDFFLAGKRIPWWAAGLSVYGTQLSAITFMAIPATTYRLDWVPILKNWTIILVAPFVVFLFLPFFCRLNITTAYEYLEKRFNLGVRLLGSLSFILFQLGRMGIVVLLPSVALSAVTGIPTVICILLMGILCTAYTVLGGIEAVIWTDVLQVVILLGGALLSFIVISMSIEGGFFGIIESAYSAGKFHMVDPGWDLTTMVLPVMIFGTFFANLAPYTSDQTVVQRYLTTRNEAEARKSLWTNAVIVFPSTLLFFGIGTALFVFYKSHPGQLDPTLGNDAIFPHFIQQNLPAGIAGLVIAGVFAAAMSSLDSSMNSVATAITTDFYGRFVPTADDTKRLQLARWATVVLGGLGTGIALVMASLGGEIQSLWFLFEKILGLVSGGLAGVFLLGVLTRRATGPGALCGIIVGACVQVFVAFFTDLHFFMYAATGTGTAFFVGYFMSLILPADKRSLKGLTLHTL